MSLYYGVLIISCNELGPVNNIEFFTAIFFLIISCIVNMQIFGDIAVLISVLEKKSTLQQDAIDTTNSILNKLGLPREYS